MKKGQNQTEKSKLKISLSKKGNIPWNKGMKGLILSKKFFENNPTVRGLGSRNDWNMPKGERHYRWIKDRMLLKDDYRNRGGQLHRAWSKKVKDRDGWKCKINNADCNGRMEAHHILGWSEYPELRYEINNGITLCHAHHPKKRAEEKLMIPIYRELLEIAKV